MEQGEPRERPVRILIAEDQPVTLELLMAMVEGLGYEARGVPDGEAALVEVAANPPSLILCDVEMPRLGGFDLCRRLRADPAARLIPIVLITSIGEEHKLAGIEAGADDFLPKPVSRLELGIRLRALLRMKSFTDDLESATSVLLSLAETIEAKDSYTRGHCQRLAQLGVQVGRRLDLDEGALIVLERAGYLHDIGKIAVPEAILLKPGPLDDEERRVMQRHPVVGAEICGPLRTFRGVIPPIRHHHEKLDGSGYPDGLRGQEISLEARIVGVVDVYDALASDRPYRPALPPASAFEVLQAGVRRGHWDGEVVRVLAEVLAAPRPSPAER